MRGAEVETTFTASLCLMTRDQQRSAQTWLPDSSDIELNTDRPHSSAVGPRFARQGSRLGPGNMKSNSGRTRDYLSDYLTQRYRNLQQVQVKDEEPLICVKLRRRLLKGRLIGVSSI